jgi:hypothetical protein
MLHLNLVITFTYTKSKNNDSCIKQFINNLELHLHERKKGLVVQCGCKNSH